MRCSRQRTVLVFLAVLLAGSMIAPIAFAEERDEVIERDYRVLFDLSPRQWGELNMAMEGEGMIVWDVRSVGGQEIYLDLHSHPDPDNPRQVEYHEQFESTTGESGAFTASQHGVYSILVMNNQAQSATIEIRVTGPFGIDSLYQIEPLEEEDRPLSTQGATGPSVLIVMASLVTGLLFFRSRRA